MPILIFHVNVCPSGKKITKQKGDATAAEQNYKIEKLWNPTIYDFNLVPPPLLDRINTMASSRDVRDIMGLSPLTPAEITREMIMKENKPKKSYGKKPDGMRRPEGMARELYNLLYNDNKDAPPIIQTDTAIGIGEMLRGLYF